MSEISKERRDKMLAVAKDAIRLVPTLNELGLFKAEDEIALLEMLATAEAEVARLDSELAALRAELAASQERERRQWRPIESAPKDGTAIQLWWPQQYHCPLTGHWADKWNPLIGWKVTGWNHDKYQTEPTHWQPLPSPPTPSTPTATDGPEIIPVSMNYCQTCKGSGVLPPADEVVCPNCAGTGWPKK